jgi:hypothetical protein
MTEFGDWALDAYFEPAQESHPHRATWKRQPGSQHTIVEWLHLAMHREFRCGLVTYVDSIKQDNVRMLLVLGYGIMVIR